MDGAEAPAALAPESAAPPRSNVRRAWLVAAATVVAAVVVTAVAAGWDVATWLSAVWDSLTSISPVYLVAALALQTLQTVFAAAAWHGILRYAYPESEVRYRGVLACYATGAALNSVTPAHAGTLVTALMFVAIIPLRRWPGSSPPLRSRSSSSPSSASSSSCTCSSASAARSSGSSDS